MLKRTVIAVLTMATGAFAQSETGPSQADVKSNRAIAAIQRALTEYGYGQLKPTGTIGSDTIRAIQRFERDHKLPVTGQPSTNLVKQLSDLMGGPLDYSEPSIQESNASSASSNSPNHASRSESLALPTFAWPVRGKIVTAFGAKMNGKANDGINLAVPEGTPIKVAEDGVVAYAGDELKGYGNLILVRHANGYVTAYAHASELLVSRGNTVKRGQVIAKSGQSGEVGSPQLHFEVRKGLSAIDPLEVLLQ